MRIIVLLVAFAAWCAQATAQETRIEVTKATTSVDDARPNNDSIPAAYGINGAFARILVVRQKYRTDLLRGLEQCLREQHVRNAVILSGIGSVRSYHYHTVSNRTFPSKNIYIRNPTASADLLTMTGYVINGRVHSHVTLADTGKAFGGHLEEGTEVFTFAVITLGVLNDDLDLTRVDDKTYR